MTEARLIEEENLGGGGKFVWNTKHRAARERETENGRQRKGVVIKERVEEKCEEVYGEEVYSEGGMGWLMS